MKNQNKHSIKCNKRDKTILGSVVYRVERIENSKWVFSLRTKYEAFEYLASLPCADEYHIIKVTREKVIS